jgi:GNAT superfamily N-acetyltransferase
VLRTESSLHADGEPDDFVSDYTGLIRCEDDAGAVRNVGKVHAWRIHADLAERYGGPLFDVCDAHSHGLHVVHTLAYEPGHYRFRQALIDRFDALACDCLVLDHVVLHPRWRGLRLGLLAARKLVDRLGGGCGLAVCDVAPLRHDAHGLPRVPPSWLPRHRTEEERGDAIVRLRRYYRQMGFERIGRTPYYGLSMARRLPTLADLLKPQA